MRRLFTGPLLPLLFTTTALAQGIPSLGVSADVGAAIPLGEFARDGAGTGLSLGASASFRLTRVLGAYASWERASLPVKQSAGAPGDGTWTDNGVGGGVRLWLPVKPERRMHPWAQLGLGWHDLDAPIAGAQYSVLDTKGLRTIEAGGGVDIALDAKRIWFLRPIVRYRRYSFTVEAPGETSRSRASYLTIGLGLVMARGPGVSQDSTPGSPARTSR
jgi:hypothetical protein